MPPVSLMTNKGRPTKLTDELQEIMLKCARTLGATDRQLASIVGVTEQTINNWKIKHPDFFESLKTAKEISDLEVAQSFRKRATGFNRTIEKVTKDGSIQAVLEEVPPDTAAGFIWLKNRQGWADKKDIEHSGEIIPMIVMDPPPGKKSD